MSEEKNIMNSPFLIWGFVILIPLASFGLYVYEVFFKEDVPQEIHHIDENKEAIALYKEAKLQQIKGTIINAYANYNTIIELHKSSPNIVNESKKRINEIKKNLQKELNRLLKEKKWKPFRRKENQVKKILPHKLKWFKQQLKTHTKEPKKKPKKEKESKDNSQKDQASEEPSNKDINNTKTKNEELIDLKVAVESLVTIQNFDEAFSLCKKTLRENKKRRIRKKIKQIEAYVHYEYAINEYNTLKEKLGGANLEDFKKDFPEEITKIKAHLKTYLKMAPRKDKNRNLAKKIILEIH